VDKSCTFAHLDYASVSTYGPTLDAQLAQLRDAGCARIYREKVTRSHSDRLARSTFDLFGIVKRIVDAKAQFRSLAEPWADTGTSTGRLILAVLGGLADVERDLIRTRTAEGRSRAKAQGRHMGRTTERKPLSGASGALRCKNWRSYDVGISTIRRVTRAA
jgi:DNA invertase Pin-like site-specific DNA recombinase